MVGGGSFLWRFEGVCAADGFQRSYASVRDSRTLKFNSRSLALIALALFTKVIWVWGGLDGRGHLDNVTIETDEIVRSKTMKSTSLRCTVSQKILPNSPVQLFPKSG